MYKDWVILRGGGEGTEKLGKWLVTALKMLTREQGRMNW